MIPVLTNEIMRFCDDYTIKNLGIDSIVLMENAGREIFKKINEIFDLKNNFYNIEIYCGNGNNAGDGFVIARYLFLNNINFKLFITNELDNYKNDAKKNLDILLNLGVKPIIWKNNIEYDANNNQKTIIIDALLGTGIKGNVRGIFEEIIDYINNRKNCYILSVDIPSGLCGTTGFGGKIIKADYTFSIAFLKLGYFLNKGIENCGKIELIDISIPNILGEKHSEFFILEKEDIINFLPERNENKSKSDFGHLVIIGGSKGMSGAVSMTAEAACRIGAGLVTAIIPEEINNIFEIKNTEAMSFPYNIINGIISQEEKEKIKSFINKRGTAIVIGPGLGLNSNIYDLVYDIIVNNDNLPILIDADGLNILAKYYNKDLKNLINKSNIIITPHEGEFKRLFNINNEEFERKESFLKIVNTFNKMNILLKGKFSLIKLYNNDKILINPTGNSGLAKGGMGDILSGLIGGLLAQNVSVDKSLILGTYLHGLAADLAIKKYTKYTLNSKILLNHIHKGIKFIKEGI